MTTTRWNKSQKNGIRKKRGANDNISCQNYWGTADGVSFIDKKEKKKNSLQADTRTTVCVCVCRWRRKENGKHLERACGAVVEASDPFVFELCVYVHALLIQLWNDCIDSTTIKRVTMIGGNEGGRWPCNHFPVLFGPLLPVTHTRYNRQQFECMSSFFLIQHWRGNSASTSVALFFDPLFRSVWTPFFCHSDHQFVLVLACERRCPAIRWSAYQCFCQCIHICIKPSEWR